MKLRTSEKLFQRLCEIKDEINKQIPLASNRYEEYECAPANVDLAEIDKKFFAHEQTNYKRCIEYYVFDHIKENIEILIKENNINFDDLSPTEFKHVKEKILLNINSLFDKAKRLAKYSKYKIDFTEENVSEIHHYMMSNLDQIIQKILNKEELSNEYQDFTIRNQKTLKVLEHRKIVEQQFIDVAFSLDFDFQNKSVVDQKKIQHFNCGIYLDRVKTDVGFCGEHTSLGLIKIYENNLVSCYDIVEIVEITYLDDTRNEDDGHTFLAINRDPNSKLNDILSWGKDAILFDPWNKLVCWADEFESLPYHYFSFPPGIVYEGVQHCAKWDSIKYNQSDSTLLRKLQSQDAFFILTGNIDLVKREQALKEEFCLTSLHNEELQQTKLFIETIVGEVKPDNFNMDVEYFITTRGSQFIKPLPGFSSPKIAIHKDFLSGIRNKDQGQYTVEELKFGLACALQYIKHHPLNHIVCEGTDKYDEQALEKSHNGAAAISFLQKNIHFQKNCKFRKDFSLSGEVSTSVTDNSLRIKFISAKLAENEAFRESKSEVEINDQVIEEISTIKDKDFFDYQSFSVCEGPVAKINYLKARLSELKNELIPYELTEHSSVRLIQFCELISSIGIDLSNQHHAEAVDDLLNSAFEMEISGFEQIYLAIVNISLEDLKKDQEDKRLPPLGIFKYLQQAVNQFVEAKDFEGAQNAAKSVVFYSSKLKFHFVCYWLSNNLDTETLKASGKRFFLSHIGYYIDWKGFASHPINIETSVPKELVPDSYLFINDPQNYAFFYIDKNKAQVAIDINSVDNLRDTLNKKHELAKYYFEYFIQKAISEYILKQNTTLPWDQHLLWIKSDSSQSIANALWTIGVVRDKRLWEAFPCDRLRKKMCQPTNYHVESKSYNEEYVYPLVRLSGELFNYGDDDYFSFALGEFEYYLSKKHQLKTDMFKDDVKFEQAFIKFFDVNHPALINPGDYFNDDNAVVRFLLAKFCDVAQRGSDEEKEVVRSFFLGRNDSRDLRNLCALTIQRKMLSGYSHYVEFFLLQRFREELFPINLLEQLFKNNEITASLKQANDNYSKAIVKDIENKDFSALQIKFKKKKFKDVVKPFKEMLFNLSLLPENKPKSFSLFSKEEILTMYSRHSYAQYEITPIHYISMFDLPHSTITLECLKELVSLLQERSMNDSVGKVINYHLKHVATYPIISHESALICDYLLKSLSHIFCTSERNSILKSLQGSIPSSLKMIPDITCKELIIIYRTFDQYLQFKSFEQQQMLGKLILEKLDSLDINEQDPLLEMLIFTEDTDFSLSLNDMNFRNQIVHMWINNLLTKYGKDTNQHQDYQKIMSSIINKIYLHTDLGDAHYIFSELANAVETQWALSEHMGVITEPDKFLLQDLSVHKFKRKEDKRERYMTFIGRLGKEKGDRLQLLNFLSSPLTQNSSRQFAQYLIAHNKVKHLYVLLGERASDALNEEGVEILLQLTYHRFWLSSVQKRAVIIDYLLIPADAVIDEATSKQAYEEAFVYVTQKLFPHAYNDKEQDENEIFAVAFLKAYLHASNQFLRNYLLAAMLVATNQFDNSKKTNVGKKLAVLCEHLGPAYVKLAQAIHSYPATPEAIRQDLDKVKSKANPPTRWNLWRIIREVLSPEDFNKINKVGTILGSASFNIAAAVEYDGKNAVLLLLRENAKKDAKEGFSLLRKAIEICDHKKIDTVRHDALSLIQESEDLSFFEMDYKSGDIQGKIAKQIYKSLLEMKLNDVKYQIHTFASSTLKSGPGYRFITRVYGSEFNELPINTSREIAIKKMVAKAIMTLELSNILRGSFFDCDRHGNQLKVSVNHNTRSIEIGLYDFGEMSMEEPTLDELKQLATFVNAIPQLMMKRESLVQSFSNYIHTLHDYGQSTKYLMRIRKGLLALQDFQKYLDESELYEILKFMPFNTEIHPMIRNAYMKSLISISFEGLVSKITSTCHAFFAKKRLRVDEVNCIEMKENISEPKNKPSGDYCKISPIINLKRFHDDDEDNSKKLRLIKSL